MYHDISQVETTLADMRCDELREIALTEMDMEVRRGGDCDCGGHN